MLIRHRCWVLKKLARNDLILHLLLLVGEGAAMVNINVTTDVVAKTEQKSYIT